MRSAFRERSLGTSARDQAYIALRRAIVGAELEPGRRLSENQLAELIGVSRTPVRDALARLRDERLVAIVPQLGTFVTPISEEAVADATFAREALEGAAIRLAAERAQPADLEALNANLEEQELAREAGDLARFDVLDEDLHRQLCDLSGHGIAWTLSRRVSGHLGRVRELGLRDPDLLATVLEAHREIVEAVGANDADRAEARLRAHLRRVLSTLPALRVMYPGFFEDG
jgi:DNA-binding GntR family transcriptional regulator